MALMELLDRIRYRLKMLRLAWSILPVAGGSPDGEGEGDGEGDGGKEGDGDGAGDGDGKEGDGEGSGDGEGDGDDEGDGEGEGSGDDGDGKETVASLKRRLRLAERQGKNASKRDKAKIAGLEKKLREREDADKSEQEKAVEAAREEGATSAKTEFQKERRSDRLALAVTRLAGRGVKIGEGDDAETVKFSDKGTLVLLQRALESDDLDSSSLFDDKDKVRDEGLREAVAHLLDEEEWLIVRPESNDADRSRARDSDAGRGGGGAKSLDEMTPDEHLKQVQKR